jgi:hypothetical protein
LPAARITTLSALFDIDILLDVEIAFLAKSKAGLREKHYFFYPSKILSAGPNKGTTPGKAGMRPSAGA